uniref:Secreted protein n=1 Tax=Panagrellus redivivus TaxID=6233 RepID=A0A7E4UYF1_PANRE
MIPSFRASCSSLSPRSVAIIPDTGLSSSSMVAISDSWRADRSSPTVSPGSIDSLFKWLKGPLRCLPEGVCNVTSLIGVFERLTISFKLYQSVVNELC